MTKKKSERQHRIELAADLSRVESRANVAERTLTAMKDALRAQFVVALSDVLAMTVHLLADPDRMDAQRNAERAWRNYAVAGRIMREALGRGALWDAVTRNIHPELTEAITAFECSDNEDADE